MFMHAVSNNEHACIRIVCYIVYIASSQVGISTIYDPSVYVYWIVIMFISIQINSLVIYELMFTGIEKLISTHTYANRISIGLQ